MQEGETFELTEDHLKLLKAAWVEWNHGECGAPGIDNNRPYGNGDFEKDIANILGWKYDDGWDFPDDLCDKAWKIHKETQTALQIVLFTQSFEPGLYLNYEKYYSTKWRKIK